VSLIAFAHHEQIGGRSIIAPLLCLFLLFQELQVTTVVKCFLIVVNRFMDRTCEPDCLCAPRANRGKVSHRAAPLSVSALPKTSRNNRREMPLYSRQPFYESGV
jgi:hypothetical protein